MGFASVSEKSRVSRPAIEDHARWIRIGPDMYERLTFVFSVAAAGVHYNGRALGRNNSAEQQKYEECHTRSHTNVLLMLAGAIWPKRLTQRSLRFCLITPLRERGGGNILGISERGEARLPDSRCGQICR